MTVEVPFRLARRDTPAAAEAFLLFAADFAPLADACARLGAVPEVYPVRGGFVLVPRQAAPQPLPGAIRLRRVSGDLFTPADATLLPALLPDEVAALTRDRGLVALPGGVVLAFDPDSPLSVGAWLAPARVRHEEWQSFPAAPDRADRLTTIERPAPPVAVVAVLAAGAPDDADPLPGAGQGDPNNPGGVPEDARPQSAPILSRMAAGAGLRAGQFFAWLGRQFGSERLARLGGDMARRALEQVPRLSERVLGAQEAALREVLRQLRSGDVEKGLRRAPIAVPDPSAPARVGTSARLGDRDPRYSLRSLVGGSGGVATGWLGGGDVWAELAREYRRLAQEAAARGDHRRAAYLYGVLLRDIRSAANALMAGGLFRDAAVLFRDRLHDEPSAASAFEQAGDYDEALRLYDRLGRFEEAGELLRRLGDDERALGYFTRAADRLARQGRWLAAGDLMRAKAADRVGATRYYRAGWAGATAEAVACGERLLDEYLVAEDWPRVAKLFDEAQAALGPHRAADAARFFNYARKVGEDVLPPEMRDDLADRTRLLFAGHLRSQSGARAGTLVGVLFGREGNWPGPVVRDAVFAAQAVARPSTPSAAAPHESAVRLADGTVTAVAVTRDTRDLVVATTTGVVCWRPEVGKVVPVFPTGGVRGVLGLATDPRGDVVYVLHGEGGGLLVRCFSADRGGTFYPMGQVRLADEDAAGPCHLAGVDFRDGEHHVWLAAPSGRTRLVGRFLRLAPPDPFPPDAGDTHLLVAAGDRRAWDWNGRKVRYLGLSADPDTLCDRPVPWEPGVPAGSPLAAAHLDWATPAPRVLEVVGVDTEGVLYWSEFDARDPQYPGSQTASLTHRDRYLAACLLNPGMVAAATGRNEVQWLRVSGAGFKPWATPRTVAVPARVVALAARPHANEVVAVLEDGSAVRLPRP